MKHFDYKHIQLFLFILLFGMIGIPGQAIASPEDKDFTKVVEKSFPTTAKGLVELKNKYGNVNVHSWDRPEVNIKVTIKVKAPNEDKANETFSNISVKFNHYSGFVSAETEINAKRKWWRMSNQIDYAIHYEVHMPTENGLELNLSYGNLFVGDLNNNVVLDVEYGNVKGQNIKGSLIGEINHGNASFTSLEMATMEFAYGSLQVTDVENLTLESQYSNVTIENVGNLDLESKNDRFIVGKADNLNLEARYSHCNIDQVSNIIVDGDYTDVHVKNLLGASVMDMNYGESIIYDLHTSFSTIEFDGTYASFSIKDTNGSAYKFETSTTHGNIDIEDSKLNNTEEAYEDFDHEITGYSGSTSTSKLIKVDTHYGNILIKGD